MILKDAYWITIVPGIESREGFLDSIDGKWLCFGPKEELHLYVDLLNTLVEEKTFRTVKISVKDPATDPFPHKDCVLCVFTSSDRSEIERVGRRLREIGLNPATWKSEDKTLQDWGPQGKLHLEAEVVQAKKRLQEQANSATSGASVAKTVFLSHASPDADKARRIVDFLESQGIPCWIAPRDIPAGSNYDEEIIDAIEHSPTLAVLVSESAGRSDHVKREVELAAERGAHVLPIRMDATPIGKKLRYFLAGKQWIDAVQLPWDEALDQACGAVRRLARSGPDDS